MIDMIIAIIIILVLIIISIYFIPKLKNETQDDDNTFEILGQTRGVKKDRWL